MVQFSKTVLGKMARAAGDVLLPRVCIVCGERLNMEERHICLGCLADMPLTRFWERDHNPMADKFNEKVQKWLEAKDETEGKRERYAYAAALFFYHSEAGYRYIPYQIKYHGNLELGRFFGRMLGKKLVRTAEKNGGESGAKDGNCGMENIWSDVDMVIPVPLHWARQWKRGYNQAEVIAGAVAETMGVPIRNDILMRNRRTKTQVKLGIEEKARNVNGAFAVRENVRRLLMRTEGNEAKAFINDDIPPLNRIRHIIIVDDVFTTGSTLTACFKALRNVFPPSVRISVLTLGYLER